MRWGKIFTFLIPHRCYKYSFEFDDIIGRIFVAALLFYFWLVSFWKETWVFIEASLWVTRAWIWLVQPPMQIQSLTCTPQVCRGTFWVFCPSGCAPSEWCLNSAWFHPAKRLPSRFHQLFAQPALTDSTSSWHLLFFLLPLSQTRAHR